MYYSHIEDFVKEFYTRMDINDPLQLNFKKVSSKLGIRVFYWNESSQALFLNNYSYIFLNNQLTEQAMWQDFCHELAHVLLHVGNQRQMPKSFREYQEAKANNFMYHACVPTFMLEQLEITDYTNESIKLIQTLFNVEKAFALHRLTQYLNKKFFMLNSHGA
ncbi:ImmA/IrrE family metallo-endopeptidase [Lysinibacillus halotolerans]|uniref:ImmA/IrrE family metallo-endopeptidase n=2 Tax=Lysinibacillus halotolerans TaxID=1368476 RepID=A0A3M8H7C0_9BACI|nr:ImmA/IrrE family metallo-endopeptidase [Lysinibacillus halotolerans]